jgi:hypothetical protein
VPASVFALPASSAVTSPPTGERAVASFCAAVLTGICLFAVLTGKCLFLSRNMMFLSYFEILRAQRPGSGFMDSFGPQMRNFAQACLSVNSVNPVALLRPAVYAMGELRVALAMYKSATSGAWEAVQQPPPPPPQQPPPPPPAATL